MRRLTILSCITLVLASTGCRHRLPPDTSDMESEKVYIHRVETKKENLKTIAAWYTGNSNHWRTLLTYNGHIRPFALTPSVKVRIPEDLIVRFDPIDEDFIAKNQISYSTIQKKTAVKKNEVATVASEPEQLFDDEPLPHEEPSSESQQEILIENLLQGSK